MFLFCLVFALSLCASVYMCFVVTYFGTVILKSPPFNSTKFCILFMFHVVMKADVFIKYKIVFADYDKRNSSEMEVCFFRFQKKET